MPSDRIIHPQAKGSVLRPKDSNQPMLKTGGSFFGRVIGWLSAKLPGGGARVRRNNEAITRFIRHRYRGQPLSADLRRDLREHAEQIRPITARQVQRLERAFQNNAGKRPGGPWALDQGDTRSWVEDFTFPGRPGNLRRG